MKLGKYKKDYLEMIDKDLWEKNGVLKVYKRLERKEIESILEDFISFVEFEEKR